MEEESNQTSCFIDPNVAHPILITIYVVIFIGGLTGISLMIFLIIGANKLSVTTTSVINLLLVHGIFLISIPFRIAYYVQKKWSYGLFFCRIVSAMTHIHIYISFIFYVIMLSMRYISFFKKKDKIEFYRMLHSLGVSGATWIVTSIIILPLVFTQYGKSANFNETECFQFQDAFESQAVVIVNYISSAIIFTVVSCLLAVQIFIIVEVIKQVQRPILAYQETWVQLKSLFFILVMIMCFFPFHMLKIYYVNHTKECFYANEICLSITALSCLDFLFFAVKTYYRKVFQFISFDT
ncbi:probable G-protein coupled receptor 141 [Bufo bufo]|uniref:probable G-protein coupled receptor 141 n=1 Tax=Bufo bufo TaxID=8384 RepID=UPI001ABDB6EC|nr:probable G-protein coupled receptor 141 [Bufo bufo]